MDKSTQITPESSPSVFKDRADEIIKLLNETPSDVGSSITQDTIEIRSNKRKAREEPTIKGNEIASNLYANKNSFEFWSYCDEELDSSIMNGAEGNGIGARGRPAKAAAAGGNGDKNPQTKRPRGRPAKAAANGTTIEVVQEKEQQPASGADVGRGTEQQSSDMQESSALVAKPPIFDNLGSLEDLERYRMDLEKNNDRYSDLHISGLRKSHLRLFFELFVYVEKLSSSLIGTSLVKGPLIIDKETCEKQKIEIMDVTRNKVKKSFYYTLINNKGQLSERRKVDGDLRAHMGTIRSGRGLKYYCRKLLGCDIKNGQCSVKGRSDHVLNHIRGQLGFNFVCFYCDAFKSANTQHFKKHFTCLHWKRGFDDQLSRKKSTTKSAETVNDSNDRDDDKGKKKLKRIL